MKLTRLLKAHPITTMLLLGLLMGAFVDWMDVHYDSSGVLSVFFYLSMLLAFPVWIAHELLSSAEFLRQLYVSKWVAAALGLGIAMGLDHILKLVLRELKH